MVGLPLNGRDATQLVLLAGSAVTGNLARSDRQPPGGVSISVAGGTGNSILYLVDGGCNNRPRLGDDQSIDATFANPSAFPGSLRQGPWRHMLLCPFLPGQLWNRL